MSIKGTVHPESQIISSPHADRKKCKNMFVFERKRPSASWRDKPGRHACDTWRKRSLLKNPACEGSICPPWQRSVSYKSDNSGDPSLIIYQTHMRQHQWRVWIRTWHRWWTCPGSSSPAASPPAWWLLRRSKQSEHMMWRRWGWWRRTENRWVKAKQQTYDAEGVERELLPQQVHALL